VVNAGPVALCESFLAKDQVSKFPVDHVRELKKGMDYFVLLCAFAVKLHKVNRLLFCFLIALILVPGCRWI